MRSSWTRSQASFVGVIVANLASLAVIRWYDWQAHAFLVVYWLETGVVATIYAAKILRAQGTDDPENVRSRRTFAGEPAESYVGKPNRQVADALVLSTVGPWLFTGAFILLAPFSREAVLEPASFEVVALAGASLVAYHVVSYWVEYVGPREYERRGPVSLLVEPGTRFWALWFALFVGLGGVTFTENPTVLIVALVFFKTCADLLSHRRARKRALE